MEENENVQALSTNSSGKLSENIFRLPKVPKKKKDVSQSPLKDRNADEILSKLSLLPGTSATEDKKAAMIKKLEKRRSSNAIKWKQQRAEQSTKSPQIDLGETEKSFIEQNIPEPPPPNFADLSMINPSETFIMTTPMRRNTGPLCSTPFAVKSSVPKPRKSPNETMTMANQSVYESQEDITERQFRALSVWCNMLLNTCNRFEDGIIDLGKTKQEASKQLQDLLSKPGKEPISKETKKFCYKDFLRKQEFDTIRSKAWQLYTANEFPQKIVALVQNELLTIRDGTNVYSDLILKTNLLRVFLSFHPVWLHLGMEIVFGTTIMIPDGASFLSVISRFINANLFTDAEIMKQKKYAIGSVKMLVTPEGRYALHRHFLVKTCQFLYCVETCKTSGLIPSDPRLFARKSQFKSLSEVFSELSREVLSATSLTLGKAFTRIGFQPKYKQNYFDDLEYKVQKISDLVDGVNFGKLVEVACNLGRGTVMNRLRDPKGDRLRKIGNVTAVLEMASKAGVDVGNIKPDAIVAGNTETILETLWRIIGVFVLASSGNSEELRRESLRLQIGNSGRLVAEQTASPEEYVLQICQQLGVTFGINVNSVNELRDGILLSVIWREYNSGADDVHFYKGSTLFRKVVKAAETELDVPVGLHGSLPLFIHLYLTRIFHYHRLNEAAKKIQAAWRRSNTINPRRLKEFLRSEEAEQLRRARAVSSIQRYVRGFLARRRMSDMAKEVVRLNEAAKRIQTAWRHSKTLQSRRLKKFLQSEEADHLRQARAALSIQRYVRGFLARRRMSEMKQKVIRLNEAAKKIQAAYRRSTIISERLKKFLQSEEADQLRQAHAALSIQRYVRGFLARRRMSEMMVKVVRLNEAARKIQAAWRHSKTLKSRRLEEFLQSEEAEQLRRARAASFIQRYVRGFLARRRMSEMAQKEVSDLESQIQEASAAEMDIPVQVVSSPALQKAVISMQRTPSTPELLRTLRRLRHEVGLVKVSNATYEKTLKNLKGKKPPAAAKTPVQVIQKKTRAACLIQRLWRGIRARKDNAAKIGQIREAMEQYRDNMNKLETTLDRVQERRPAHQRLAEWSDMLFGASLYKTKVAAISILRVIELSTCLCRHFVVKCEGLAVVLDRIEQTDRSPGDEEIVTVLTAVLARVIQEALTDSEVKEVVLKFAQDCLKSLFHIFHAFYNSRSDVVPSSVSGLVALKKLSSDIGFEKAGYYISQAEKRFDRLPENDPKKASLRLLSQYFPR